MIRFFFTLILFIVLTKDCYPQNGVSAEFPEFEAIIYDSSSISDEYISIGLMGRLPDTMHAMILGKFGNPIVHIWGGDTTPPARAFRPWRIGWTEIQNKFSLVYLGDGPIILSSDLESFDNYELDQRFDGRSVRLTEDGKIITLINIWEMVYDLNDDVSGDSIPIEWTVLHVEDSLGNKEIIDISEEYSSLDVYSFGTFQLPGQTQIVIDPVHGNSMDYKNIGDVNYYGQTFKSLNEVLIIVDSTLTGERKFYHFGGPLNQFSYSTDTVLAYNPHDFNFLEITDSTITITFYSDGISSNSAGNYASGKIIRLNLLDFTAELLSETVTSAGVVSLGMGSYDAPTNSFAPGIVPDPSSPFFGISARFFTELNQDGSEKIKLVALPTLFMTAYRHERYPVNSIIDSVIKRPVIASIDCDTTNMTIRAFKEDSYDDFKFFVNNSEWHESINNDNEIELPIDFSGTVSVMSRYEVTDYDFFVDKYSEVITVPKNYCLNLNNNELNRNAIPLTTKISSNKLYLTGASNGYLFDVQGKEVMQINSSISSIDMLISGIYILHTEIGSIKFFVP